MKDEIPSASISVKESTREQQPLFLQRESPTNELSHYLINYRNFCSAQKSLFIVNNPNAIFSNPEVSEFVKVFFIIFLVFQLGNVHIIYSFFLIIAFLRTLLLSTKYEVFQFKPLKKNEHDRIDRGSIVLLHNMIKECIEPYNALPKESKLKVIQQFFFQFNYLHRCYMSANYYPDIDDPHICPHFGYYVTKDTIRQFFEGLADIEENVKYIHIF